MNVTTLLLLLLTGSILTFLSGDKHALKTALFFSLASFGFSICLISHFLNGIEVGFIGNWIENPNVHLAFKADGLALAMVALTTSLSSIILFSSFNNSFNKAKNIYALILFMTFAMSGTFLSSDGLLYYVFGSYH